MILVANISIELATNIYFWKTQQKRDDFWSNTTYKIFDHEKGKFTTKQMNEIKIAELILLKEKQFCPADVLVLDTGTIKLEKKIFKVTQDRLMGDQNLVRYAMSKFLSTQNADTMAYKSNSQKVKSQIRKLSGLIQYKHPETCMF